MPSYDYRCRDCGAVVTFGSPVGDVAPGPCDAGHPSVPCNGELRRVWSVYMNRVPGGGRDHG